MEADGTLFVDGMLLNEMLKMGMGRNRRNRGADLKTPELPRWRARDLSVLVHGRDPRHGEQRGGGAKKRKENIYIYRAYSLCACVSVNMACVYIRACLTYHKTRQTMALLWCFFLLLLPWHLTRIAEFQIAIFYELLLVGPVAFINIRSPAM